MAYRKRHPTNDLQRTEARNRSRSNIRCKKCGNEIKRSVEHCPYCGVNQNPIYKRMWFWVLITIVIVAIIFIALSRGCTASAENSDSLTPVVVGAEADTAPTDLALGTTVEIAGLNVTVTSVEAGPVAYDGSETRKLTVSFENTGTEIVTLLSSQIQMESTDGTRFDAYTGTTEEGEAISGNYDVSDLAAGATFTGQLYYSGTDFAKVVYAPDALSYDESQLVTWAIPATETAVSEDGADTTQ